MTATDEKAAPVVPGAPTPGGDRSNPSIAEQKGNLMLEQPINTDQAASDGHGRFTGDRNERLAQAANLLADDENMVSAELPYNSEGIVALAESITELRLLEDLTEGDADWTAMLASFDFCRGLRRMAWRIGDLSSAELTTRHEPANPFAVVDAYCGIFRMVLEPFVDLCEDGAAGA